MSRALGVKPFTTEMEEAFLQNLRHALSNILIARNKYEIQKEVSIAHVFSENIAREDLFYSGRFDFVVYQVINKTKLPILVIELDGKEHYEKEVVMARDKKKKAICEAHNMQILRVENAYARRYNYIKDILIKYFSGK